MSASNPTVDELEVKLATELKHTLKLVPESQRELFVFELARWYSRERTAAQTELLDKVDKGVIGENEKHPAWCGDSCDDTSHITNQLRTEQRKKLIDLAHRTNLTGEDKDNE